ncbi:hypothetical protein NL108_018302 [Boleophthalmus pectinirostris]|nr:hypothetical protein NL108_018302 [Boleophthalmus pectinirostris]
MNLTGLMMERCLVKVGSHSSYLREKNFWYLSFHLVQISSSFVWSWSLTRNETLTHRRFISVGSFPLFFCRSPPLPRSHRNILWPPSFKTIVIQFKFYRTQIRHVGPDDSWTPIWRQKHQVMWFCDVDAKPDLKSREMFEEMS